jgi:hypothetical protein
LQCPNGAHVACDWLEAIGFELLRRHARGYFAPHNTARHSTAPATKSPVNGDGSGGCTSQYNIIVNPKLSRCQAADHRETCAHSEKEAPHSELSHFMDDGDHNRALDFGTAPPLERTVLGGLCVRCTRPTPAKAAIPHERSREDSLSGRWSQSPAARLDGHHCAEPGGRGSTTNGRVDGGRQQIGHAQRTTRSSIDTDDSRPGQCGGCRGGCRCRCQGIGLFGVAGDGHGSGSC